MKNLLIILSLLSIPVAVFAMPSVKGEKLLLEKNGAKFYVSKPRKDFDSKYQKDLIMVSATIDNPRSDKINLVTYMFDCDNREVKGLSLLFDRKTEKVSNPPPNLSYGMDRYYKVNGGTVTYDYYAYACKK